MINHLQGTMTMRAITQSVLLLPLLFHAAASNADANDGGLFGFSLGDRYTEQVVEVLDEGQLVLISTRNPVKPADIEQVYVLVTPISHSIGKIAGETWYESGEDAVVAYERFRAILRNKYSGWDTDERTEQHYHASRFWAGNHELNVQASGPHNGEMGESLEQAFLFRIVLSYLPSTPAAIEYESLANAEIEQSASGKYSEEEVQGL
jgi:hypothetical protein